ncbi:hypothetical protein [Actinomyces sp. HMSC065F11]|uniref:DUF7698 family protein n=1 Tax=Actinomyces sp. HMSC065F11 TaxID=1739395 RepID=UPI0008A21A01|nr:hypothetical protein [Actinomyces sp. HMSC065F11]OFR30539.1 hypothetical protein HMPREF2891_05820 [Actinomyces sp. HMSC065F11]
MKAYQELAEAYKTEIFDEYSHFLVGAYVRSRRYGKPVLDFDSSVGSQVDEKVLEGLDKLGIKEVTISSKSTALMSYLDTMVRHGWIIAGMTSVNEEWVMGVEVRPAIRLIKP